MFNYRSIYEIGAVSGIGGDRHRFRSVARTGFNALDSADTRFFKILFYFQDRNDIISDTVEYSIKNSDGTSKFTSFSNTGNGLLVSDWIENEETPNSQAYYTHNSAYSYLMNNLEVERAEELKQFIGLLSNISSNSPWYFKEVSGVDEALERENFKIDDERKKITITCMDDPIDRRISTLLSAYRSIVWSHARKCEVLPANLRKFDMGLFIFSGLTVGPHILKGGGTGETFNNNSWMGIDVVENEINASGETIFSGNGVDASNKFIEFHNCEISMDSIKSGFSSLSNEMGTKQEFKIDIYFDDCYEMEYNQFLMESFGDLLLADVGLSIDYQSDPDQDSKINDNNVNPNTKFRGIDMDGESAYNILAQYIYPYGGAPKYVNPEPSVETSMSWKERIKAQFTNAAKDIGQEVAQTAKSAAINTADKAVNALNKAKNGQFGLGNFYDPILQGSTGNISTDLTRQAKLLTSKAIGNVNSYTTKILNNAQNSVQKAVSGVVNIGKTYIQSAIDIGNSTVLKGSEAIMNIATNAVDKTTEAIVEKTSHPAQKMDNLANSLSNKIDNWTERTNIKTNTGIEDKFKMNGRKQKQEDLGTMTEEEEYDDTERVLAYGSSLSLGSINSAKSFGNNL